MKIRGQEATLADYIRRVELYGSECVLEVAAGHLPEHDLGALKGQIAFWHRNYNWHLGQWVAKRQAAARSCEGCGLDLPVSGRRRRYHDGACRQRAARARKAEDDRMHGAGSVA